MSEQGTSHIRLVIASISMQENWNWDQVLQGTCGLASLALQYILVFMESWELVTGYTGLHYRTHLILAVAELGRGQGGPSCSTSQHIQRLGLRADHASWTHDTCWHKYI